MFELRILDEEWVNARIGTFTKGTLQYRQWKIRIDASGGITPLPAPIEWTEWIDVPTEKLP